MGQFGVATRSPTIVVCHELGFVVTTMKKICSVRIKPKDSWRFIVKPPAEWGSMYGSYLAPNGREKGSHVHSMVGYRDPTGRPQA